MWSFSINRIGRKQKPDSRDDADISLERQRVVTGDVKNDVLVLNSLTKRYRRGFSKITAVDNLCLGIPQGEVSKITNIKLTL